MYNSRGQLKAWRKMESHKKALIAQRYFSNQLAAQKALLKSTHLKYFDIQGVQSNIENTWRRQPYDGAANYPSLFAHMTVGEDISQRSGQRIWIHSVKVHLYLREFGTALAIFGDLQESVVRLALVQDNQTNGSTPAGTDPWAEDKITTFQTIDDGRRFTILKDKTYVRKHTGKNVIKPGAFYESPNGCKLYSFEWRPTKPLLVNFTGPSTGIANVVDNNIFLTAISQGWYTKADVWTRICFTDG